jgi:hypothetical protein
MTIWSANVTATNTTPTPAALAELQPFTLFVCYTNTDLTEGRGYQVPYAWSDNYATALRLAHKKGVQGSDAQVVETIGYPVGRSVYGPVRMERASDDDKRADAAIKARSAAIQKARSAGLSEEEIAAIRSGK